MKKLSKLLILLSVLSSCSKHDYAIAPLVDHNFQVIKEAHEELEKRVKTLEEKKQ